MKDSEILHVIVGHSLPTLYLNTVNSFRTLCPVSKLLVIDNNSPQSSLREELERRAAEDPHMELILRDSNELIDPKVGALYQTYRLAFGAARRRGVRYVHLMQADMQLMWWDQDALDLYSDIYERHPGCVNIYSCALTRDRTLMGDLRSDAETGDTTIPAYPMTDTGIFDLERWDASEMEWRGTEYDLADSARVKGLHSVVCDWPTEIQVPWPAVVRQGRQIGREVPLRKPFLCRPLDADAVATIKVADHPVTLEEICVPWGWSCLSPMHVTDTRQWYYLNYRRHALAREGWAGRPRWVVEGLDNRWQLVTAPRRPRFARLLLAPLPSLAAELVNRACDRWRQRPSAT